jgi:hypothetical protein
VLCRPAFVQSCLPNEVPVRAALAEVAVRRLGQVERARPLAEDGAPQRELQNEYPIKHMCDWRGNSPKVAPEHYLMAQGDHFARAATTFAEKSGAESGAVPLDNHRHRAVSADARNAESPGLSRGILGVAALYRTQT